MGDMNGTYRSYRIHKSHSCRPWGFPEDQNGLGNHTRSTLRDAAAQTALRRVAQGDSHGPSETGRARAFDARPVAIARRFAGYGHAELRAASERGLSARLHRFWDVRRLRVTRRIVENQANRKIPSRGEATGGDAADRTFALRLKHRGLQPLRAARTRSADKFQNGLPRAERISFAAVAAVDDQTLPRER